MDAPRFPSLSPGVAEQPDPEKITAAGEELLEAHRCLLRAAHHLDDSPTRLIHADVQLQRESLEHTMVKLTEWGGS